MEINKKNILILFLLLFAFSFDTIAQIKDVPVVKVFEKEYYKYDIKAKESLYSVCKKFNVTEAELLSMNPKIVNGLKSGQTLMIPVKTSKALPESKNDSTSKLPIKAPKPKTHIETTSTPRPRITIFLPFASTTSTDANDRYIEFYEGFLLAVDSLKSLGLSFEVQTLEAGINTESIAHAIVTGKLIGTDYCIGGINPEQISILAEWAKKNQKKFIAPFSSRIKELDNNPYLFQTITPYSYLSGRLADYYVDHIEKNHVVFLNAGVDDSDVSKTLIPQIKSGLKNKGLTYSEAVDDEKFEALSNALSDKLENTIVPTSLTPGETSQLVARLAALSKANPEKKITLFGYPDWQALNKNYQFRLHELDTYIYSNFYADQQQEKVRDFQLQYTLNFGKTLLNTFPKYGMMGYDLAAYFIPRMVFEKSQNRERVPTISSLQNNFQFRSKSATGGFFNQIFYIIHYNRNNTVEIIPLQ